MGEGEEEPATREASLDASHGASAGASPGASASGAPGASDAPDAAAQASATAAAQERAQDALEDIHRYLPYLAEIADAVSIAAHPRVPTACVFADGRMLVGRDWFGGLTRQEALFVLAHELWHLVLKTHERLGPGRDAASARLMNIAHDYVINDILSDELGVPTPCGGLVWEGARHLSAERIIKALMDDTAPSPAAAWSSSLGPGASAAAPGAGSGAGSGDARNSALADALEKAGLAPERGREGVFERDALREEEWEPYGAGALPLAGPRRASGAGRVGELARRALERVALEQGGGWTGERGRGGGEDGRREVMRALKSEYRIPIELAFQSGFDLMATPRRSYARLSRRQGARTDLVLAGRLSEGFALNLILDTSGSMHGVLRRLAGAIQHSATAAGIEAIRVIQSGKSYRKGDAEVEIDRVETALFNDYELDGWTGATPMHSAFGAFGLEADVETVGVITDLGEPYPATPPPFHVVWFWTEEDFTYAEEPPYGDLVRLPVRFDDGAW